MDAHTRNEPSSIGTLFSSLTNEVTTLVRGEVRLAQAETAEKATQAGKGVAFIAASGAILFCGFIVLLAAAVFGLNTVLPPETTPWLSALIVGGVVLVIGAILLQMGRKKLQSLDLTPDRTVASFKSDKDLVAHHKVEAKEEMK
ncbi:phage holin family protein [Litchfieldella xinjiangensis]|uniref:phage holin family protein n=1 Tax=Litchfieldella xinjiangensis TaxID=1166948 RepID=UPI0005BBFE74|nr:phage holin family protein [Halomonas xinjiangensis]